MSITAKRELVAVATSPDDAQRHVGEPDLDLHRVAGATPSQRIAAGLRKERVGPQHVEPIGGRRDEPGLDQAGAEDVDADDAQRLGAPRDLRVDLDDRARDGDPGHRARPRG